MACAKFCSDMIPYNGVTLKQICHRIWIRMDKILHEMAPWAENNHRSGKNYGWNVVAMETHYFIIYYLNTFIRRKGMWLSQKQVCHNTGNIIFTAFIPKQKTAIISRQNLCKTGTFWYFTSWRDYPIHYNTFHMFMPCCVLLWFVNSPFTHIFQRYCAGTGTIIQLPQCQWSNPKIWSK